MTTPTPPAPKVWTVDEKLQRAVDITNRETIAYVQAGRAAGIAGAYIGDSPKLWALNTLAEHYLSLPPADDPEADAQTQADLDRLADEANTAADAKAFAPVAPFLVDAATVRGQER